jgi:hypothetical protein
LAAAAPRLMQSNGIPTEEKAVLRAALSKEGYGVHRRNPLQRSLGGHSVVFQSCFLRRRYSIRLMLGLGVRRNSTSKKIRKDFSPDSSPQCRRDSIVTEPSMVHPFERTREIEYFTMLSDVPQRNKGNEAYLREVEKQLRDIENHLRSIVPSVLDRAERTIRWRDLWNK